ncbi:MAG: M6 family metalloprotease domain-containing protein [Bacteroidales bacterium]|nr:M6 family metalloprotease domain-containing protein [Bacteroidales bacterium]
MRKKHMNRSVLIYILLLLAGNIFSAPLSFVPVQKSLPDGRVIELYISGDEFFNYLHDAKGLPLKKGADGYYYYLIQEGDDFKLTGIRAGEISQSKNPGVTTVTIPSWVEARRDKHFEEMTTMTTSLKDASSTKSTRTFNNLVIYIRFSGESDFTVTRAAYNQKFNSLTESSLRHYYKEASYGKMDIVSHHFPGGATENLWFTDIYPRAYYQPYDVTNNPSGYKDNERATREHGLLERAVVWATQNYSIPVDVDFDLNDDGKMDNISFVVKGSPDGWGELLWPHRWTLYTRTVKINDLSINSYTLQLENVTVGTLCHEMFHSLLGAPDLYHYDKKSVPVGPWDLMGSGRGHPGAWMKHKYGGWIDEIPEIKKSGTYSLKTLAGEESNSYIIRTPYSTDQFFVVEYRKKEGFYEGTLPASGMIIQRIDNRYRGNASGPPDEVYVFRKNGTPSYDGTISSAALPGADPAASFSDNTNPYAFLQEGTVTGINITDIKNYGDSILFTVNVDQPVDLNLVPVSDYGMSVSWKSGSSGEFIAAVSEEPELLQPLDGKYYNTGDTIGSTGKVVYRGSFQSFTDENISGDEIYYYSVWAVTDKQNNSYSQPASGEKRSGIYTIAQFPYRQEFDDAVTSLPRGWRSSLEEAGWRPYISQIEPAVIIKPASTDENFLYTPGFTLVKGEKYSIKFNYRNLDPSVKESLFLKGGEGRYEGAIEQLSLFSSRNFSYTEEIFYRAIVQATFSGTYYFGFKTGPTGTGVVIDNFIFEKVPGETRVLSDPGAFYPNPGRGVITVPATGKTNITVYSTDGIKLYETDIEGMREVDLSHLGQGLFILKFTTSTGDSLHRMVIN